MSGCVALGLALTVVGAQPAAAARWDVRDPAGDAFRDWDIRTVTVWNGWSTLTTRVRFVDVRRRQLSRVGVLFDTGGRGNEAYAVSVLWRPRRERFVPILYRNTELGDGGAESGRVRCPDISVRWRLGPDVPKDWVNIRVPQRCFGVDAGPVRIQASTVSRMPDLDPRGGDRVPELGTPRFLRYAIPRG